MGIKRTAKADGASATRKSSATKATAQRAAARKVTTKARAKAPAKRATRVARPSLASLSAQIEALSRQVSELAELLRGRSEPTGAVPATVAARPVTPPKTSDFEGDLVAVLGELDRRARHSGLIPIPDVRAVFVERGWTRSAFDERLLEAERHFIVDLKAANDPRRLTDPALAIQAPGRGHLQFVVAR